MTRTHRIILDKVCQIEKRTGGTAFLKQEKI